MPSHGTQRFAGRQLEDLVAEAGRARIRASTLGDLLDRWLEAASPGWSASTVSHTRSIVDCHLKPHLGHLDVAKLTAADIDESALSFGPVAETTARSPRERWPVSTVRSTGRSPKPCGGTGSD